jgi:hypothetical protein
MTTHVTKVRIGESGRYALPKDFASVPQGVTSLLGTYGGNFAFVPVGQTAGTVAAGNDPRFSADGAQLVETPLAKGSSVVSIPTVANKQPTLPLEVAPNTVVSLAVDAEFSAGDGNLWVGTLFATARRVGSGDLTLLTMAMSAGTILSNPDWNPEIVQVGNALELHVTESPNCQIVPRGFVRASSFSTANDPEPTDPLVVARAAVLADDPQFLLYSDVGLSPDPHPAGTPILVVADQSAHGNDFGKGDREAPQFGLDGGGKPFLNFDLHLYPNWAWLQSSAPACDRLKSCSLRWTMVVTDRTSATGLWLITTGGLYLWGHNYTVTGAVAKCILNDGTNQTAFDVAIPEGKHCYELRVNRTTQKATLIIDRVAGTPINFINATMPQTPIYIANFADAPMHLYGMEYQEHLGTDEENDRWIAMSQLAWGNNG